MKSKKLNEMQLKIPALSQNESICRSIVGAFVSQLDPSIEELADIKCSLSEAVTNCIVHAYRHKAGDIYITVRLLREGGVRICVRDRGCGIEDVSRAMEPLFTTDAQGERSGMGFTVMENFMDRLAVYSSPTRGTLVVMSKRVGGTER